MLDKEDRTRMLSNPKSSSQKTTTPTLLAAMAEERANIANRRFLSKDAASVSNPSFRVYYGDASAGSVPFLWESAPGTPKNATASTTLPPLTPPPSYYNSKGSARTKIFAKSQSSKKLLSSNSKPASSFVQSILPKLRRSHTIPSRSPPPSKEGAAAQAQCPRSWRNRLLASPRSSFSSNSRGDDDGAPASSPTSTLCFRTPHSGGGTGGRLHGFLASVVGGGQGTAAS